MSTVTNRQVTLARRPHGLPTAADFELKETPLPEPGGTAIITGGLWNMRVGLRQLSGPVEGFLVNNGDETFAVITELTIASGGIGSIAFEGILDHNVFPPTIKGLMSQ